MILKELVGILQVKYATPIELSQQYDAQQILSYKVFYVTGDWRFNFHCRVEATTPSLEEEWLSVEIWICRASSLTM